MEPISELLADTTPLTPVVALPQVTAPNMATDAIPIAAADQMVPGSCQRDNAISADLIVSGAAGERADQRPLGLYR